MMVFGSVVDGEMIWFPSAARRKCVGVTVPMSIKFVDRIGEQESFLTVDW